MDMKRVGIQNTNTECDDIINRVILDYTNVEGYPLREGLIALQNGDIDVFCSTGNTKTVIIGATSCGLRNNDWKNLSIAVRLPNGKFLTDVGAKPNFNSWSDYRFALEQLLYSMDTSNIFPNIGLLNIGEESDKGGKVLIDTYSYLKNTFDEKFIGNVEGFELDTTKADIILTNGYTGNIVLKMLEKFWNVDWSGMGGAYLLGMNKPIIIGHGRSTENEIRNIIGKAL